MEEGKRRRVYDKQYKLEAIKLVTEAGRSVRDVARDLGIDANTLYHWKRELTKEGEESFPGKGHMTVQEEEIRRLRKELAEAKEDREILKKALGYFSKSGK
jgi:transposase